MVLPASATVPGCSIILSALVSLADASAFLGPVQPQGTITALSAESEHALLVELEAALGSAHRHATERRLSRLEQRLRPMFASIRKNKNGKLGAAAAGYILHRVFVQRHGWFIRSLEPVGNSMAAWNTSSPTVVLEERVSEHVQKLFQDRLGENGLGVKELAILAATLEHLVHGEALDRLRVAYTAASFSEGDVLSEEEAIHVLEMYMSIYILGFMHTDLKTMSATIAQSLHANIFEVYPTWPETQQFLREVYRSVAPKRDYLYFNEVENVIAEIGERYGRFQDIECRQLKDMLVASEDPSIGGAGRVRISDFYKKALNEGKWQFTESVDYLRNLGALDESDAENPRVIIPNYISGPSNCVASSAYYSVCCLDECEGILAQLEQSISAPEASPSTIVSRVSMTPSASMPSNRTLSSWLQHRLDEVAKHHGGLVPLHGRLFTQWLHYAYPRECPFPHVSGTINPKHLEDVIEALNGTDEEVPAASEADMQRVVAAAPPLKHRIPGSEAGAHEESGMWSMEEELVVWHPPNEPQQWGHLSALGRFRGVTLVGVVLSLSVALVRSLEPALRNEGALREKHYV